MNIPFLSIIIPCYNCERFIERTLSSLINQTSKNFELILVDDGSTDNSYSIAKEILEYSNIQYKLIKQDNGGVSVARNNGINSSQGKYVYFLDADDYIETYFCENMENLCKSKLEEPDMIFFNYDFVNSNLKVSNKIKIVESKTAYTNREVLVEMLLYKFSFNMCSFIVKRSILNENKLLFSYDLKYGEDCEFILKCVCNSNKILKSSDVFFHYCLREESATHNFNKDRADSVKSATRIHDYLSYYFKDINDNQLHKSIDRYVAAKTVNYAKDFYYCKIPLKDRVELYDEVAQNIKKYRKYLKKFTYKNNSIDNILIKILILIDLKWLYGYFALKKRLKYILNYLKKKS